MNKTPVRAQTPEGVSLYRDAAGVPHVEAARVQDLYWGMGWFHARDRGLQMLLFRVLGRGQGCKYLDDSEEMLAVDRFFHRMNWADADAAVSALEPEVAEIAEAYAKGVNAALSKRSPWEFKLVGYRPPPWTVADCMLLARMTGYLTLAQSQGEVERFLVELVQAGASAEHLEDLFPGHLEGLDVDLLRKVRLGDRIVPDRVRWEFGGLRTMASNNWAVAGSRTESGAPILCNDPHLEVNRLPNVWSEIVLRCKDRWFAGATMPGLPAMLVGRTPDLAWGATYAFMDATDSWVEECRDGKFRREDHWVEFSVRKVTIERKKRDPVEVTFYENQHGVLDGDPTVAGHYLATRWAGAGTDGASLKGFAGLFEAQAVSAGRRSLGNVQVAFNWVLADASGNIGYQMSGAMPRRREGVSGLVPLPGWEPRNDWKGMVNPAELPCDENPECGYIVTANQDLNHLGEADPINMCMGDYRAQRIEQLLGGGESFTLEDMQRMQYDLLSLQARRYMGWLRPHLPKSHNAQLLAEWDCRYTLDCVGATLFERVYDALFLEVFGGQLGEEVHAHIAGETGLFLDFYRPLDELMARPSSVWFGDRTRDEVLAAALERGLAGSAAPWRTQRSFTLTNVFFGGKLPRGLGFDRGPIHLPGGRATVFQGQIYRNAGRLTSFGPSFRFVTRLDEPCIHSNLLGGPSDRRFSPWYASGVSNWIDGVYKKLGPSS